MQNKKAKTHSPATEKRRLKPRGKGGTSSAQEAAQKVKQSEPIPEVTQGIHQYTTAKIVLLGGAGSGKSALFWRLAFETFNESTPKQMQHIVLSALRTERGDGTICEPVLWDLPEHPDHQLVHAIFLENIDIAIVVFDPTGKPSPLHPAEYWLKVLTHQNKPCVSILVAARVDRGYGALSPEEINSFCRIYKVAGDHIPTSAATGQGMSELIERIRQNIAWEKKEATVVTTTFERVKQYILTLRNNKRLRKVLFSPPELQRRLKAEDPDWTCDHADIMNAVHQLANLGVVTVLRAESGEESILIMLDLLIELAKNFVDLARRNRRGLGALALRRVRSGEYEFPSIARLNKEEQLILLNATIDLFIKSNVCFTVFSGEETYLVFPSLIRLKKPQIEEVQTEEDATYIVKGEVESLYSILVVLLGYTRWFKRTNQWEREAQYEFDSRTICGFRQIVEHEGEMQLVLYYGLEAGDIEKKWFEASIELILKNREVTATKYPAVWCPDPECNYRQERAAVIRRLLEEHKNFMSCHECGIKIDLRHAGRFVSLSQADKRLIDREERHTSGLTKYKAILVRLRGLRMYKEGELKKPRCFISYAWGVERDMSWVRTLAKDLEESDIDVVIDVKDNADLGLSINRFIDSIEDHDSIIVVGTPLYKQKYKNNDVGQGNKLAAEMDIISTRLSGSEESKKTIIPVLLTGDEKTSLPALLQGKVYADFRKEGNYFPSLFRLVVRLYKMSHADESVAALVKEMETDAA